jgi:hypothetical protein
LIDIRGHFLEPNGPLGFRRKGHVCVCGKHLSSYIYYKMKFHIWGIPIQENHMKFGNLGHSHTRKSLLVHPYELNTYTNVGNGSLFHIYQGHIVGNKFQIARALCIGASVVLPILIFLTF